MDRVGRRDGQSREEGWKSGGSKGGSYAPLAAPSECVPVGSSVQTGTDKKRMNSLPGRHYYSR